MKKFTKKDIKHLGKLANLNLSQNDMAKFSSQFSSILDYVDEISGLDLKDTPQTNQVTGKVNEYRPDQVQPSLTQEEALSQAKKTHKGYFIVPAVINHE